MDMGRRGRKRQLGVGDEYWRSILSGVGTVEACRRVGITRKTGYRWHPERGGLAPVGARLREASGDPGWPSDTAHRAASASEAPGGWNVGGPDGRVGAGEKADDGAEGDREVGDGSVKDRDPVA